jgi:hypothetical protein
MSELERVALSMDHDFEALIAYAAEGTITVGELVDSLPLTYIESVLFIEDLVAAGLLELS